MGRSGVGDHRTSVLVIHHALGRGWFDDPAVNALSLEVAAVALGAAVHYHRAFAAGISERTERIAAARRGRTVDVFAVDDRVVSCVYAAGGTFHDGERTIRLPLSTGIQYVLGCAAAVSSSMRHKPDEPNLSRSLIGPDVSSRPWPTCRTCSSTAPALTSSRSTWRAPSGGATPMTSKTHRWRPRRGQHDSRRHRLLRDGAARRRHGHARLGHHPGRSRHTDPFRAGSSPSTRAGHWPS